MNNRVLPIDAKLTWIYRVYALYRGFAVQFKVMPVISLDGTRQVIKIGWLLVKTKPPQNLQYKNSKCHIY